MTQQRQASQHRGRSKLRQKRSREAVSRRLDEDLTFNSLEKSSMNARLPMAQRQNIAAQIGHIQGNGRLQQMIARQQTDPPPDPAATFDARDALLEHIANELQGKPPKEKDQGAEAIKKAGEAALATETGKQIQKKVKQFLVSKKGIPVSIMLGTTGVAALIATNTDVPSIPIPLSNNMKLTIDVKGPLTKPDGVMATFELKF